MEIWGIMIETKYFAIASLIGVTAAGLLWWFQRKAYFMYRFSIYKLIMSIIGITFAVYYILHVVFGTGRTGWP